ncbi:hypothetical protein BAUCODRAFT_37552 [Baudoinia panamericana UAMH 10762]|uniref:Uncharacterized protein n=1 Tax=Baudoinia panamericana (strain UAMH 10762) TaxID=717646 RepID=M2N1W0_BAUPA|nr:uncharacterized protein BAUCODRAFT_37552 [Baudoinia panamericana UAMH 10762]EMC92650.1 hypothetical protein BAUCODRAFT_37552 [Baudoinia panamericana UAMH 10762]
MLVSPCLPFSTSRSNRWLRASPSGGTYEGQRGFFEDFISTRSRHWEHRPLTWTGIHPNSYLQPVMRHTLPARSSHDTVVV